MLAPRCYKHELNSMKCVFRKGLITELNSLGLVEPDWRIQTIYVKIRAVYKVKGKMNPRTGHEGPEVE
jgi:hypothetical protein